MLVLRGRLGLGWSMGVLSAAWLVGSLPTRSVGADYPSYPPQPTVVEYVGGTVVAEPACGVGSASRRARVAVDKEDRIWCVERGEVPVQVYTTGGELVRSWGRGRLRSAATDLQFHGHGNVWIADFAKHVVQKFTPDGKLLLTLGSPGSPARTRLTSTVPPIWRSRR